MWALIGEKKCSDMTQNVCGSAQDVTLIKNEECRENIILVSAECINRETPHAFYILVKHLYNVLVYALHGKWGYFQKRNCFYHNSVTISTDYSLLCTALWHTFMHFADSRRC